MDRNISAFQVYSAMNQLSKKSQPSSSVIKKNMKKVKRLKKVKNNVEISEGAKKKIVESLKTKSPTVEKIKEGAKKKVVESLKKKSSPVEEVSKETKRKFLESLQNMPPPIEELLDDEDHSNPLEDSENALHWLLYPMLTDEFFEKFWEKHPLLIRGKLRKFCCKGQPITSTKMIDKILRQNYIEFTKNLDITTYFNGVRETHNPIGRAYPSVVWDYYLNDCSIRMLNPQTYIPTLHSLNAMLQEYFDCFVGANLYLTPPNSQGFAPHYDDIEAFILQIEGKKRWRLYKPLTDKERLPRYSSKNFTDAEIGEPIMDVVLNQGDLLYFPRGTIHQGETIDDTHSLHITLSVYQKNSWADFMEKLIPDALKNAVAESARFRAGLPVGYLKHVGLAYKDRQSLMKDLITSTAKSLMKKMTKYIDVDKAADEMAKGHIHDYLPPVLSPDEAECSIMDDGEQMMENGKVSGMVEIEPDTMIRLIRQHCVRLIEEKEDNTFKLYYSVENSKVYHEYDIQYLEVGSEFLPAMKEIITQFPNFIRVEDLPIDGLDKKIQLAKDLWEKCLVITKFPLPYDEN